MKAFERFFCPLILLAVLFAASCKVSVAPEEGEGGDEVTLVTFQLSMEFAQSRTALPDVDFSKDGYVFSLSATDENGKKKTVFNGKSYSDVNSVIFTIASGVYDFELKAFSNNTEILYGVIEDVTLRSSGKVLSFKMYPAPGSTGSVAVTLELPLEGVASVKVGIASSPVAAEGECVSEPEELAVVGAGGAGGASGASADPKVVFESDSIQTGSKQYVVFYLYDDEGACVASVSDSLIVVHGKTSYATISRSSYTLGAFAVAVHLLRDGDVWYYGRQVKLTSDADSTLSYQLPCSGYGTEKDPFVYAGSIAKGDYSIFVLDSEGNWENTGVKMHTEVSREASVNFYSVSFVAGAGVVLGSTAALENDGTGTVCGGKDFTYTVALKPGYDFADSVTVTASSASGGETLDTATFTSAKTRTLAVNSQIVLTSSAAHAVAYKISYNVAKVDGLTPTWNLVSDGGDGDSAAAGDSASSVDANKNGIADKYESYTVEDVVVLPNSDQLTVAGRNLKGWKVTSPSSVASDTVRTSFKASDLASDFAGNITLAAVWDEDTYTLEASGTLSKEYYLYGESFNPDGVQIFYTGSSGKQTEVPASSYKTNFDSLVGVNQTVTVSYHNLTVDLETVIHRSNYEFTQAPVILEEYTGLSTTAGQIDPSYFSDDDIPAVYCSFGDWPQRKVSVEQVSPGVASNGYYIGSDGKLYASRSGSYYVVEPIVWRVLNTKTSSADNYNETGRAFLMAESCLDSGVPFYKSKGETRTIDGSTVYSTNWEYSTMRAWLNSMDASYYHGNDNSYNYSDSGFYGRAFSSKAKTRILKTTVDNGQQSQTDHNGSFTAVPEEYCGNNTQDKVFLMSEYEITNPEYGFNSNGKTDDSKRKRYRSDWSDGRAYAKSGYTHYWLRSQYYTSSYKGNNALYVKEGGNPSNYDGVASTDKGIVPAMWVQLAYRDSLTIQGSLKKSYYMAGEAFDPTGITVTYYDAKGNITELTKYQYSTNFNSLLGANSTLTISYKGQSADLDSFIHKATYVFTEEPEQLTEYSGSYSGNASTPAVYYKFGDYPQTYKDDSVTVSSGTAPCGYYIGSDGNYYGKQGSKYCLVEPLVWRVLNTSTSDSSNYAKTNKALFFAENCIGSGTPYYFSNSKSANAPMVRRYSGEETKYNPDDDIYYYGYAAQIWPNNYQYSTVRAWLNSIDASVYHGGADYPSDYDFSGRGFLDAAFTEDGQKRILLTDVSNDEMNTTAWGNDAGPTGRTRTCPDSKDRVFLLSLNDITNPAYGFSQSGSSDDSARKRYRTNFSEAQGVYTKGGYAHYMLRTPSNESSNKTSYLYVKEGGNPNNKEDVAKTDKGIVPAMWVDLSSSVASTPKAAETPALWVEWEHHEATGAYKTFYTATALYALVGEGYNGGKKGPIIVHQGTLYSSAEDLEGTPIYLVTLSGTEFIDGQATGVWTDLQSGFNGDSAYLKNVVDVIANNRYSGDTSKPTADIPVGSNLVIAGHSLGGMISQQTSADSIIKSDYNVLNVVTFGSPLIAEGSREGTLHRICDRSDIIPFASGSILSSSDAQWNAREVEDGGYGEEINSTSGLAAHLTGAAGDTRDVTGPHCYSYIRDEVWGDYDVLGVKGGTARITVDLSTKVFYKNSSE